MNTQKQNIERVIKRMRKQFPDSEAVFNRAYEIMRQKSNDRCICDVPITVWHVRLLGEFKYRCLRCRRVVSPLSVTPLGRQHKKLTDTVELACRFYLKKGILTPTEISTLYSCQYRTAVRQTKRVVEWIRMVEQKSEVRTKVPEVNAAKKICRSFATRYTTINAAVDSLFNALPSLKEAMKNNLQDK